MEADLLSYAPVQVSSSPHIPLCLGEDHRDGFTSLGTFSVPSGVRDLGVDQWTHPVLDPLYAELQAESIKVNSVVQAGAGRPALLLLQV